MEQETVYIPNKMHALLVRVCTKKNLTIQQLLENAMRRELAAELPMAKLIVKKAKELGITKGGSK